MAGSDSKVMHIIVQDIDEMRMQGLRTCVFDRLWPPSMIGRERDRERLGSYFHTDIRNITHTYIYIYNLPHTQYIYIYIYIFRLPYSETHAYS